MLFNSYGFIFAFLPIAVAGFYLAARSLGRTGAVVWLILASLVFYGWWNPAYLWLLGAVMLFNYVVGLRLAERPDKWLLAFGIGVDLAVLGYYKYAGFLTANIDALFGTDWSIGQIVLPLAISFFTFQKIAYLVDSYRGLTRGTNFLDYCLFVLFFPQLIAGPIVHWKEVLPQFRLRENFSPHLTNFAVGITIFSIGLFKKAVLADGIAVHASPVFAAAEAGARPDFFTAWGAALAYSFQLYFDFSGYSDMAIGAARLFGIKLPLNFDSPYKAANISDFWRRWHMTLSRFLRDYLYIALGGNRRGEVRRYVNLMTTMLLGGLWHGAGWTFVLWGGLHGLYLVINHGWQRIVPRQLTKYAFYRHGAWLLTFIAVVIAWVPFRAPTMEGAGRILAGMAGLNGIALPNAIGARLGPFGDTLADWGVTFALGSGSAFVATWAWIVALFLVARFMPNTQEFTRKFAPALDFDWQTAGGGRLQWMPTRGWACATAVLAAVGTLALSQVSEFLYFQF